MRLAIGLGVGVAGLVLGGFIGVVSADQGDSEVATGSPPSSSQVSSSTVASPTTTTSAIEPEPEVVTTAPPPPDSAPTTQTTSTVETQPACNSVASGRVGEELISLRRLESVSFVVEICQSNGGDLWYHGSRILGDDFSDSITLEAIEVSAGIFQATNSGWVYLASPDRLTLTSPSGETALDQVLHPFFDGDRAAGERSGTLLVDVANLRSRPSLDATAVRQVTGQEGARLTVHGRQAGGWLDVTLDGTRGWVFGAFVSPPDPHLIVGRTNDEEEAVLLDRSGRLLGVENASGSYVLIIEEGGSIHQVILADGATGFVRADDVSVISR